MSAHNGNKVRWPPSIIYILYFCSIHILPKKKYTILVEIKISGSMNWNNCF